MVDSLPASFLDYFLVNETPKHYMALMGTMTFHSRLLRCCVAFGSRLLLYFTYTLFRHIIYVVGDGADMDFLLDWGGILGFITLWAPALARPNIFRDAEVRIVREGVRRRWVGSRKQNGSCRCIWWSWWISQLRKHWTSEFNSMVVDYGHNSMIWHDLDSIPCSPWVTGSFEDASTLPPRFV